ncbi:hypothetical protein BGZ81_011595 [Podila clonocystis]|nr:hypothetical protein BGZ81_011595 [Podila clonocystis]
MYGSNASSREMWFLHSLTSRKWWKAVICKDNFSASEIPDLTGKVAIVTGANKGIGYAIVIQLAARGAKVFIACRSKQLALEAIAQAKVDIAAQYSKILEEGQLEFVHLDLVDMRQCHYAAQAFLERGLPLHLLVNNAGVCDQQFHLIDGIEAHMAINHFGHFAFTLPLLDQLIASQPSRVVVLSSIAHEATVRGGINFERMNDRDFTNFHVRYAQSKAANLLFAGALARRMASHKVYVNSVHPGFVLTYITYGIASVTCRSFEKLWLWFANKFAMPPEKGALSPLYCATSPEVETQEIRGQYFIPVTHRFKPLRVLRDEVLQERLWEYSEKLLGSRLASTEQRTTPEKT